MKKSIIIALATVAAVMTGGCSKIKTEGTNDSARRYFEAWAKVNYPDAQQTALGSYIISQEDGNGIAIADSAFIRLDYTVRTLDGSVSGTSLASMAQQIGSYSESSCYCPEIWYRGSESLYAGIEELLEGKHLGYKVKAAVPGWLTSTTRYESKEEYLANVSGTDYIYEFEIKDAFGDVDKWETDSLIRYLAVNYPEVDPSDTTDNERNKYGLYYLCLKESDYPDSTYADGDKLYFNYTGMRLDGHVFDTTIEKTAKDEGIYSSSNTYEPTYMVWKEEYTEMTMGDSESSTIDGFAYTVHKMKPGEKGIVFFISTYGYSYSGSGDSIPAYSPLAFLLERTEND